MAGKRRCLILQNPDDVKLISRLRVISSDRIELIKGAGVETETFRITDLPINSVYVVLPGRLLWDKGIKEFIDVAKRIKKQRKNVRFAIVGDIDTHNPAAIPRQQVETWIEEGDVEIRQGLKHAQMAYIYHQASIVCLPSYREGLPKVLLEAASCGRPIVAFDVPGCRELVHHDVNGFIVPFKDLAKLERMLLILIDDRERCVAMGRAGREMIMHEFAAPIVNRQTFAVWRRLMSKR